MTRRTYVRRLRDALKRRKTQPDAPRTMIVDAMWRRTNQVVHPEADLSEWVQERLVKDWDNVKEGRVGRRPLPWEDMDQR